jgi:hypothetical protein
MLGAIVTIVVAAVGGALAARAGLVSAPTTASPKRPTTSGDVL